MTPIDKLTVGSLFSGIGGIELGLEQTGGFETKWQCEIIPFRRAALGLHWPQVRCYSDVHDLCAEEWPEPVDLICGGFPCQPFSTAGLRKGEADDRFLWPEFMRIVRKLRPSWVVAENVPGILTIDSGRTFGGILSDLAASGYVVEWETVSASFVGAIQERKRVFVVAYIDEGGFSRPGLSVFQGPKGQAQPDIGGICAALSDDDQDGCEGMLPEETWLRERHTIGHGWWSVEPSVGRVVHGVPNGVDRCAALGDSVVPQVAQYVGQCILDYGRRRDVPE